MNESEWKKFKKLKELCLEKFSEDILFQVEKICKSSEFSAYDRYINLYKLIEKKDEEMVGTFDGLSRNKAFIQLLQMHRLGLVEEKYLDEFENETKEAIRTIANRDS
jgi:hypothetical protein